MIPSNYTPEEIVKYCSLPEEVKDLVQALANKIKDLEIKVKSFDRTEELLREQIYFRDTYIEMVLAESKRTTKHKELAKFIEIELENSYIELWGIYDG